MNVNTASHQRIMECLETQPAWRASTNFSALTCILQVSRLHRCLLAHFLHCMLATQCSKHCFSVVYSRNFDLYGFFILGGFGGLRCTYLITTLLMLLVVPFLRPLLSILRKANSFPERNWTRKTAGTMIMWRLASSRSTHMATRWHETTKISNFTMSIQVEQNPGARYNLGISPVREI